MEDKNFKELITQLKDAAKLEIQYGNLTLAEKLSVLLSQMCIVFVMILFAAFILFMLLWGLESWLTQVSGSLWVGVLGSIAVLVVLFLILYGLRKALVINPVTRIVTKLLLKPEE